MKAVTLPERLAHLEGIIRKGKRSFVEVGLALEEIRDNRLYHPTHGGKYKTFAEYCEKVWKWKKAYCYQLISGAMAVKYLPPEMSSMLDNPRQATELAKAPEEKRAQVIDIASSKAEAEERPITARDIKEAADGIESGTEPEKPHIQTADEELSGHAINETLRFKIVALAQSAVDDLATADRDALPAIIKQLQEVCSAIRNL